jgi:small-conductance mechanosensitive channel
MPQPAPARFDASDQRALRTSLLAALGPALTLVTLLAGYALSARVCDSANRRWIGGLIALAVVASACAIAALERQRRGTRDLSAGLRFVVLTGLALAGFSLCVLLGYALTLTTVVRCD